MGLIARALEERGIATITLTSAQSITASVGAPRGVFLDYPLGQTAGRAGNLQEQRQILEFACDALENIQVPGEIRPLPLRWSDDDSWKDAVMRPKGSDHSSGPHEDLAGDQRTPRHDSPQYQLPQDAIEADPQCPDCVFIAGD